jgi:hypothetical protein
MTKTTEIKPRRDAEMIKPRELIEMTELAPLSLQDRRIFNMLVKHAWEDIEADTMHSIPKTVLRHGMGSATERLGQSIKRIMAVVIERRHGRNGVERFHLLTHNIDDDVDDDEAVFRYTFPTPLRKIIRKSEVWARLESHVVYAFSSKYALALYELVALRVNLKHLERETFELEKFRELLGVEKGKLTPYKSLKQFAIDYAVREVNGLCPAFNVAVTPVTTSRKVTGVEVSWWKKDKQEQHAALHELSVSKIGRNERLAGLGERIIEPSKIEAPRPYVALPASRSNGITSVSIDTIEEARKLAPRYDIYNIENQWRTWVNSNSIDVKNGHHHFLKFVESFVKANPL